MDWNTTTWILLIFFHNVSPSPTSFRCMEGVGRDVKLGRPLQPGPDDDEAKLRCFVAFKLEYGRMTTEYGMDTEYYGDLETDHCDIERNLGTCFCYTLMCNKDISRFESDVQRQIGQDPSPFSVQMMEAIRKAEATTQGIRDETEKSDVEEDATSRTPPSATPEATKGAKSSAAPTRGAPTDTTKLLQSSSRPEKSDLAKTPLQDVVTTTEPTSSTISAPEPTSTTSSTTAKEPETTAGSSEAPIPKDDAESQTGIDGNRDNHGSLPEGEGGNPEEDVKASGSMPGWLIALIILLAIFVVCVIVGGFILYSEKKVKKKEVIGQEAAPAAATPSVQPSQVVIPVDPPVNPVAPAPTAPAARQPTQREKVMMQKWQDQLRLNSVLKAAENAAKVAPVAPVEPAPKKDEEVGNRRPDEDVPEVGEKATQDENSHRDVEVKKEQKEEQVKRTQETLDSVKTQPSESVKTAKKISEKEVQKKEE